MSKTTIALTGPAKIGGKWFRPGDTPEVDEADLANLRAAGVVNETAAAKASPATDQAFEKAVAAKAKEVAEAIVGAAVDEAVTELTAARDEANARAIEAEAQRDLLQDRVLELQAQIGSEGEQVSEDRADDTPKAPAAEDTKPAKSTRKTGGGAAKG